MLKVYLTPRLEVLQIPGWDLVLDWLGWQKFD